MTDIESVVKAGLKLGLEGEACREWAEAQVRDNELSRIREHERRQLESQKEHERITAEKELAAVKTNEEVQRKENLASEMAILALKKELRQADSTNQPHTARAGIEKAKIPRLPVFDENKDNIENYLDRFERYVEASQFPEDTRATVLSSFLSGNALEVYARLSKAESTQYPKLRAALLKRYEVTSESCRKKFRSNTMEKMETFGQAKSRLERQLEKWLELAGGKKDSANDVWEIILIEQMTSLCSRDLQIHIKERNPKTSQQLAEIADNYRDARKGGAVHNASSNQPPRTHPKSPEDRPASRPYCTYCKRDGHSAQHCFKKPGQSSRPSQDLRNQHK